MYAKIIETGQIAKILSREQFPHPVPPEFVFVETVSEEENNHIFSLPKVKIHELDEEQDAKVNDLLEKLKRNESVYRHYKELFYSQLRECDEPTKGGNLRCPTADTA